MQASSHTSPNEYNTYMAIPMHLHPTFCKRQWLVCDTHCPHIMHPRRHPHKQHHQHVRTMLCLCNTHSQMHATKSFNNHQIPHLTHGQQTKNWKNAINQSIPPRTHQNHLEHQKPNYESPNMIPTSSNKMPTSELNPA